AVQKAALVRLASRSDGELGPFADAVTNIVDHSTNAEIWSLAFALTLRLRPESAPAIVRAHNNDAAFWRGDIGMHAYDLMTRRADVLPILMDESSHVPASAILESGGCRAAPGILRLFAFSPRGAELARSAVDLLAILSRATLPLDD